jgi:predicted kinase
VAKPKLYYFIGYPGSGKTTLAVDIATAAGAIHIWADDERHKLFPESSHSEKESLELYDLLNARAEKLLSEGENVVFDTNFNFYSDREKMREIAARQNAEPILIWMDVAYEIAKDRAVCTDKIRNGYKTSMSAEQFDNIASKLEVPRSGEPYIKIEEVRSGTDDALRELGLEPVTPKPHSKLDPL